MLFSAEMRIADFISDIPGKGQSNATRLRNPLVEWLFYPEYVDLKGLAEDHHRVHKEGKESGLMEQPCRFPVTNQGNKKLHDTFTCACFVFAMTSC